MAAETKQADIIIIGSGPGGQKAALQAASEGKRAVLIERDRELGGACVHQGTIPSKTLREAALTLKTLKNNAAYFSYAVEDNQEVSTLMVRLESVLKAHSQFIGKSLESNSIQHVHGRAKLVGKNTVAVTTIKGETEHFEAPAIVLATGSRPRTPPEIAVDHEHVLDSDSVLRMIYLPRSLVVYGGGVIGAEYASIFTLLGVKVTLVDKAPRPLMFLEKELTDKFLDHFKRNGGEYLAEEVVEEAAWDGTTQVNIKLQSGQTLTADKMLVAQGRLANVENLGLEDLGIEQGKYGHVAVNEYFESSVPGIYAVGDVIGPPALASVSMEQGRRAACHALGVTINHPFTHVPMGIYAVPEIATVGLSEDQAREQYGEGIKVGRAKFDEVARGIISGQQDGLLKMVACPEGKKLLGVQIVIDGATDLVHVGEMALLNDNDISVFLENILNFPTMGEAYRIAAFDISKQVGSTPTAE